MKGWIRLGVVLSAFWVAGVLATAIGEFSFRNPEACVKAKAFLDTNEFFFSCNEFADLVPNPLDRFLLEFNKNRFFMLLLGPLFFSWTVAITVGRSWQWVMRGFRK